MSIRSVSILSGDVDDVLACDRLWHGTSEIADTKYYCRSCRPKCSIPGCSAELDAASVFCQLHRALSDIELAFLKPNLLCKACVKSCHKDCDVVVTTRVKSAAFVCSCKEMACIWIDSAGTPWNAGDSGFAEFSKLSAAERLATRAQDHKADDSGKDLCTNNAETKDDYARVPGVVWVESASCWRAKWTKRKGQVVQQWFSVKDCGSHEAARQAAVAARQKAERSGEVSSRTLRRLAAQRMDAAAVASSVCSASALSEHADVPLASPDTPTCPTPVRARARTSAADALPQVHNASNASELMPPPPLKPRAVPRVPSPTPSVASAQVPGNSSEPGGAKGYDISLFLQPQQVADLELVCSLCSGALRSATMSSPQCGHTFCARCLGEQLLCPESACNQRCLPQRCPQMDRMVLRQTVACVFRESCSWTGRLADLPAHAQHCEHAVTLCEFAACEHRGSASGLRSHLQQMLRHVVSVCRQLERSTVGSPLVGAELEVLRQVADDMATGATDSPCQPGSHGTAELGAVVDMSMANGGGRKTPQKSRDATGRKRARADQLGSLKQPMHRADEDTGKSPSGFLKKPKV